MLEEHLGHSTIEPLASGENEPARFQGGAVVHMLAGEVDSDERPGINDFVDQARKTTASFKFVSTVSREFRRR